MLLYTQGTNGRYFYEPKVAFFRAKNYNRLRRCMLCPYIFLDNTPNREDILKEFLKGVKVANRDGYAIMIGHIWSGSNLANLLEEVYPVLKSKGYTLVTPGDLYENLGY